MTELLEFLQAQGFADFEPILDNTIHRFDHHGTGTGWFIGGETDNPKYIWAKFGDWKTSESHIFKSNTNSLTPEEKKALKDRLGEIEKNEEKRKTEEEKNAKKYAQDKWDKGTTNDSPYLLKKGFASGLVKSLDLRTVSNAWEAIDLLIPLKDFTGEIWSIQKVQADGQKFFQPGGKVRGLFYQLGGITPQTQKIFIAEGIATAISVFQATGVPTVCAFNASNIEPVAKGFRGHYPNLPIIIAGDDDRFTVVRGVPTNIGKIAATKAAASCQGVYVLPEFKDSSSRASDWNDLHIQEGLEAVKIQLSKISIPNPKEFIETQESGFHRKEINDKGKVKLVPSYDDLLKYYKKVYDYKILDSSELCLNWNGKYYQECRPSFIKGFAEENFFPKPTNHMVSEFVEKVGRQNSRVRSSEWFSETTSTKINFNNGVYDKDTGDFEAHNPTYGFRYVLRYDFDPKAKCQVFDKFLNDITKGDTDLQKVILEFMGYAISNDDCSFLETALVLEGEGANGKSTLSYVLKELAGQDNYTTFSITDLDRLDNRYTMDGKLFNIAEETPKLALTETSLFKDLTSGGDIQARPLFKKAYKFRNKTKLIFACNELPKTKDTTYGLSRKLTIVPFKARFTDEIGNKDIHIKSKLKCELPGIFNKVWEVYRECKKRGYLTQSLAAKKAIEDYKDSINPMKVWIESNFNFQKVDSGCEKFVTISKMYSDYRQAMETQGERFPHTWSTFCKNLRGMIPDYENRKKQKAIDAKNGKVEYALIATIQEYGGEVHAI